MVSYGQVRQWRPEPLDETENQLKSRSDQLLGLADELSTFGAPAGWTGDAAQAAAANLKKISDRMEHIVAEVNAARTALITAADDLTGLQHLVKDADGLARAHSFTIDDRGDDIDPGVSPDVPLDQVEAVKRERAIVKSEIQGRVSEILDRAEVLDERLTEVLDKVRQGGITDGGATTLAAAANAGAAQGSLHDHLLAKYQVSVDPDGMTTYPSGAVGWIADQLGIEPLEMTASEARHLEDRGYAGAADAYGIYKTAIHDAENVFNGKGVTDGHSDAFRHAYWNAMLSDRFGEQWAASYTTAYERVPEGPDSHATAEAMDLHNNEVGRRIFAQNPDADSSELKQLVKQAVENGEMVVVNAEGRLVRSDEVDLGETGRATDPAGKGGVDPPADDTGHSSGGYNYGRDGDTYGTYDG